MLPRLLSATSLPLLATALLATSAEAESGHTWMYRSSPHFTVTYDASTAPLADRALGIAEATASQLGTLFGWEFKGDKIAIVLLDDEDASNGLSLGRTALVQIYCRKVPMEWRDETRWLETVLSHELSHVYTLAQMQRPFAFSFGVSDHSDAGLKEWQYGSTTSTDEIPRWFVEGMAQIGSNSFGADRRDPLREVLLGDAFRNGLLLGWEAMARFEGTSRENELVYNQGFDLLLFLRSRYPQVDFRSLCRNLRTGGFLAGIKEGFGKPLSVLYVEWKASLGERFPKLASDSLGPKRFGVHEGLLVTEAGAAGRFAVANWKHDYLRFDLFETGDNGGSHRLEKDVGEKVVVDAATGSVWFTASLRNTRKGADQFDLFRRDKRGSVFRETEGARCIAFDVANGELVYASYDAGVTKVTRRDLATAKESLLHSFPYDTAVYEIALGARDTNSKLGANSVYMVLGTGDATRAAVIGEGGIHVLWARQAPVRSLAPGKGDTLFFAAIDSGVPRLFWSRGEGSWQRVGGSMPVRSVWMDRSSGEGDLLLGVWEHGGRVVRQLAPDWNRETEPVVRDTLREGLASVNTLGVRWDPGEARQSQGFLLLRMPWQVDLGYGIYRQSDTSGRDRSSTWHLGVEEEFVDPTLSSGLGLNVGGFFFPSGVRMPTVLPAFSVWGWMGGGDLKFQIGYSFESRANGQENPVYYVRENFGIHSVGTKLDWLLSRRWQAETGIDYTWMNYSYTVGLMDGSNRTHSEDLGKFASNSDAWAALSFAEGDSRMDPANLGAPGTSGWLYGRYRLAAAKKDTAWRPGAVLVEGSSGLAARAWLLYDRASLAAGVEGYGVFGGIDSLYLFAGANRSMGGKAFFAGYADNDLRLRSWICATGELRVSPFAARRSRISWTDRTRIASRLEVGEVQYLSKIEGYDLRGVFTRAWTEKSTLAASWDLSLRQGFYLDVEPSWLEIGVAIPLERLDFGRRNDPYRLYFGLQVQ